MRRDLESITVFWLLFNRAFLDSIRFWLNLIFINLDNLTSYEKRTLFLDQEEQHALCHCPQKGERQDNKAGDIIRTQHSLNSLKQEKV